MAKTRHAARAQHDSAATPNAAGDQNHVCATRPSGVSLRPHMRLVEQSLLKAKH